MVVSGQVHALAVLSPRKEPQHQLHRRLGGPLSGSGHCGEEKNLFPLLGIESRFLSHPAHNPVAVPCSWRQQVPPPDNSAPDYTTLIFEYVHVFRRVYRIFTRKSLAKWLHKKQGRKWKDTVKCNV
jgi:hypothetical protein